MERQDKITEALQMRVNGSPIAEIATKTGLNAQEVVDVIAEGGDTIITLKGIQQEAMLTGYGVTKRERLKRMVSLRDKLQAELDSRDFSDIPTEKIPQLLIKINEAIRSEVAVPQILSTGGWTDIADK